MDSKLYFNLFLHLTFVNFHSHHFTKGRLSKRIVFLFLELRHAEMLHLLSKVRFYVAAISNILLMNLNNIHIRHFQDGNLVNYCSYILWSMPHRADVFSNCFAKRSQRSAAGHELRQDITLLMLLDLSPAFDSVDHSRLLSHMISCFGIGGVGSSHTWMAEHAVCALTTWHMIHRI